MEQIEPIGYGQAYAYKANTFVNCKAHTATAVVNQDVHGVRQKVRTWQTDLSTPHDRLFATAQATNAPLERGVANVGCGEARRAGFDDRDG
ncbi:MAG: hypothetical protein JWM87_1268 [Candidatus Eremiobacteraeota bacterium]|nr:hypothetical protein [Candidatus Eremiobacteraeota bacterium]